MLKMIVGNLKMNLLTLAERDRYLQSINSELEEKTFVNSRIVICPPALHLEAFSHEIKSEKVSIGVQDIFWEDRGSFTGETSPLMVKNFGADYAIIGHSERRKYFGETDAVVNAKMKIALKDNLNVIYCVGETAEQRNLNQTNTVIEQQIKNGLSEIPSSQLGNVIIAYEPVWAIGGDVVPSSDEIMSVKISIHKIITENYGASCAEKVAVLYGGSVNARTVKQVCIDPGMDGVLVGRESLIPSEFMKIVEIIDKV